MNLEKFWNEGLTFQEYVDLAKDKAENTPESDDYAKYYVLGWQRIQRTMKTIKSLPELQEKVKNKDFKLLIISEPWCGDASTTVPAVATFFGEMNIPVKIFLRDTDTDLIDQFLTDGTRSIPKVLVLNAANEVQAVWGPRPAYGLDLLKKFKQDPEAYPREEFYNDLQVYYAKNKGKDAIEEIIHLIF